MKRTKLQDGNVFIVDRIKELIKVKGLQVEKILIEQLFVSQKNIYEQ